MTPVIVGPLPVRSGPKAQCGLPANDTIDAHMTPIDFFGCKREQIVTYSFEAAYDRFPCAGITMPNASALISLGEALTGKAAFLAEPVLLSLEPFRELSDCLQAAVREASAEELMDADARWAELLPWKLLDTNPRDLAGFLLHLQSLAHGPGREGNSIFLLMEPDSLPAS